MGQVRWATGNPSKHRRGGTGPGGCWSCVSPECAVVGSVLSLRLEPCEIPLLCLSGWVASGPRVPLLWLQDHRPEAATQSLPA